MRINVRLWAMVLAVVSGLAFGEEYIEGAESVRSEELGQRHIFVFLDGTGNNAGTETNVYKLYREVLALKEPSISTVYLPGVGSALGADATRMVAESGLGKNQQQRIISGYRFVAAEYRQFDRVYLFGFSRGAMEARALAGWLSYSGVPKLTDSDRAALQSSASGEYELGNSILQKVQYVRDAEYVEAWRAWTPASPPVIADFLRKEMSSQEFQSVPVAFVGVWDTVPGSTFKEYGQCKEKIGGFKRKVWWLPGVDRGERYKLLAYPPIAAIAHTVSLDEQRSTFRPVLVCDEYGEVPSRKPNELMQIAFPGAHSDVGGGYPTHPEFDKEGALPNHSLNWMIDALKPHFPAAARISARDADAMALAHWSIGDAPGNIRANCESRRELGWMAKVSRHDSVSKRASAEYGAPIRFFAGKKNGADVIQEEKRPYPDDCKLGQGPN
ncbi:MAG: hypothetical protein C0434_02500 [Xanthomonadaceae bacterium]|nr:hypothetical protein [Xanthomonadaceae bacterium]